ncbi:hypothetical protein SASPL_136516 [Salvia splendens]|uniref:DUF1308 domain-containing protein n=1 Tax=Salvia splendens TaxID=180675 RepID=A0A8X8X1U8_SALSN|nr:hypothetical protein SASPL_136516 [Salvia splendens]
MEEKARAAAASPEEDAKRRCDSLIDQLQHIPRNKLSPSSKTTLCRLINSELTFLHRISAAAASDLNSPPLSLNIGHLEAVVHVLRQPSVTGVSRVCKPIEFSKSSSVYVDVVCSLNGNPVWFIVSGRKPRCISWNGGSSEKDKGLRRKIQLVVDAARHSPALDVKLEPLCYHELELEEEWTDVVLGRLFPDALLRALCFDPGLSLRSLVAGMKCWCCSLDDEVELQVGSMNHSWRDAEAKLVNFDTTAMVAIASGISNGRTEKLLATPERQLRDRFKGNYDFVITQVDSGNQNPIHRELPGLISGKRGIICASVWLEFQELITMCGGPNEKLRAEFFLKFEISQSTKDLRQEFKGNHLRVVRLSTINMQVPNILTFLSLRAPSLTLTGTFILRSRGTLPVCCAMHSAELSHTDSALLRRHSAPSCFDAPGRIWGWFLGRGWCLCTIRAQTATLLVVDPYLLVGVVSGDPTLNLAERFMSKLSVRSDTLRLSTEYLGSLG